MKKTLFMLMLMTASLPSSAFFLSQAQSSATLIAKNNKLSVTQDQKKFKKIRNLIMEIDHSWDTSAKAYINLYKSLKK